MSRRPERTLPQHRLKSAPTVGPKPFCQRLQFGDCDHTIAKGPFHRPFYDPERLDAAKVHQRAGNRRLADASFVRANQYDCRFCHDAPLSETSDGKYPPLVWRNHGQSEAKIYLL